MSQASITECNTANDAANALLNGGTIEIKSGAEPDIDGAISGTILETFTIPATAFGASSNRIATMTIRKNDSTFPNSINIRSLNFRIRI